METGEYETLLLLSSTVHMCAVYTACDRMRGCMAREDDLKEWVMGTEPTHNRARVHIRVQTDVLCAPTGRTMLTAAAYGCMYLTRRC